MKVDYIQHVSKPIVFFHRNTIMYMNRIIAYHTPNLCAYVSYWIPLKTENTTQLEDKTRNINMHCLFLRKQYQECL